MVDDKTPKGIILDKLYGLSKDNERYIENAYITIGKLVASRNCTQQVADEKIEDEKKTIRFYEGVMNGLSQAASLINQSVTEEQYALAVQLRNWIMNSDRTKSENDEILKKANELVESMGIKEE